MFDDYQICPYTGLRSFTEEESIYFKGRDEHIQQATDQLARNKFLMLTGASGDGKSSLVFAGIIPNARAGFLKSKYTDWSIVNFRPERSPLKNLSISLAKALDISNVGTVESELQHGFSALVDLYKSSKRFIDESSAAWQQASEDERKSIARDSSNLLILADQFEEFFTNPENYIRGVPSNEATLTLNLLLETAKIALRDNLPIYVVFTMRSDYIGQCAAFRGLPEYIGFSQLFVPRLNRKQLQEVIEEPATLSGISISRRLVERLIHDVTEGLDQLPILQHALNQIWKAADDGKEELDLIHYAMVGGMASDELPDDQRSRFEEWFKSLSPVIQACHHSQSLQNVLDTHANIIYESAASYVKEKTGKDILTEDAHLIIKTTFTCLTKIDHSRAVRNRMTLEEIKDILNRPDLDTERISAVIDIFREPGNTFIHPFITENENKPLTKDTVLDITHESLIRNWVMLMEWADEEYDKFAVFADFKQQVDRWLEHRKSWGFLLPIGSLAFFEHWFKKYNPNAYWVNRYNEQVTQTAKNIEESREIMQHSEDFLRLSARKHAITKAIMKFGPRRIAAILSVIVILVYGSFTIYDNIKKKNFYVLNQIKTEAQELLGSNKATAQLKGTYLVNQERNQPGAAWKMLDEINDDFIRLEAAIAMATNLYYYNMRGTLPLYLKSITYADSVAQEILSNPAKNNNEKNRRLTLLIELADIADWINYYHPGKGVDKIADNAAAALAEMVYEIYQGSREDLNIKEVNEALECAINHQIFTEQQIDKIIEILSPFDSQNESGFVSLNYRRDRVLAVGTIQDKFSFNGLYIELANLYAAKGDVDHSIRAIDTLLAYHPNLENFATDAYTVGGYFALYGHWEALNEFSEKYAERTNVRPYQVYQRILDRSGKMMQPVVLRFRFLEFSVNTWSNPVLEFMPDQILDRLYEEYLQKINEIETEDDRNFALAQYYKKRGVDLAKRSQDKRISGYEKQAYTYFDQSWEHYQQVSENYKNTEVSTFFRLEENIPIKNVYLYPDYRELVPHYEPRSRYSRFYTGDFMAYLLDRNLFTSFYKSINELELVTAWINEYKSARHITFLLWYGAHPMEITLLEKLHNQVKSHPEISNLNISLLKVLLANRYFEEGRSEEAAAIAGEIDAFTVPVLLNEEFNANRHKTAHQIGELFVNLSLNEKYETASELIKALPDKRTSARWYDYTAIKAIMRGDRDLAKQYLDSAKLAINEIEQDGGPFMNYKKTHAFALAMEGKPGAVSAAKAYVSDLNSFIRFTITYRLIVMSTAFNKKLFEAYQAQPRYASSDERLMTINEILYGMVELEDLQWKEYDWNVRGLYNLLGYNR